ncbi:hypothetical protein H7K05_25680, partial [Priestia aryabhattai]|nr:MULTISPECIES: hypothetical protein [Priestia]MBY0008714.1 hypothetical protein [Priestia aryabhattai]MEB4859057.1 hypothetical protein [Priestia megaterium]
MDMNQYLEVFIEESKEHLQNVNDQLMRFEKNTDDLGYGATRSRFLTV